MPVDLIIRGGQVVTAAGVAEADLAIDDGKIVEVGAVGGKASNEIDASGLHLFPGVIDPHVHFNEPGRTEWEGLATGSSALAAGGGTCFFDMPLNSHPPVLNGESFDAKLAAAQANSRTDFALWGGLTPSSLDHMEELAERGVIGFKAFMSGSGIDDFERADDLTLLHGMRKAAQLGRIVAVHAESEEITARLTAEARARGGRTWKDYVDSRPIIAETEAVARAISLAIEANCDLHIVHVSNSATAKTIAAAQEAGATGLTFETCPHYFSFNEDDLKKLGGRVKCAPPLRSAGEMKDVWHELGQEKFQFVASDHSPCLPAMKENDDAFEVWGGVAGVQSTLNLMLSGEPALPLPLVARLTSENAAERFGLKNKGKIEPDCDADLAIIDLENDFELTRDMLLDRHKLNPYVGRRFRGQVIRTMVRGHTVFENGQAASNFRGQLITPAGRADAH